MDIGVWLRSLSLEEYEAAFRDNAIDADVLHDLTDQDLNNLGVLLGHRRKLLRAIAALDGSAATATPAPLQGKPPAAPVHALPKPPAPPAPEAAGDHRHVTVMFCDLVDSTGIAAKLDAEEWRDLFGAYLEGTSAAVTEMGGSLSQRPWHKVVGEPGDGLMVLFGYPVALENDAERAARAALAIQRSVAQLNRKNICSGKPALAARIAIDWGPVVVEAGEIFGDVPNIAARAQTAAEPGEVVVTARVLRQIAGLFVAEERGSHRFSGVPEPVTLFRLVRASGVRRRAGQRRLTPLVGRDEELAMLLRRWERARRGDGQLVLIIGEPGLGKSRLMEEFQTRLRDTPHTWVEWSCSQLLQNTPLHPIAEWGRERFGGADVPAEQRIAELESTLTQIKLDPIENVPLLATLLAVPLPKERMPTLAPEDLRRRQLGALTAILIASARLQPMVLALEDLHWADPSTLDVLRGIAESGALAPLIVLVSTRPEFRLPWGMRSHHGTISLAPLDRDQVRHMVGNLAAHHVLAKDMIDGVTERTGGVPLFIEEVTRLLLERGEQGGIHSIPPTLQQSLTARLDRLGSAREVAQIGAVIGRDFTYWLLRTLTGMDDASLQAALDRLAEADILLARGLPPQSDYRFKHALIQDAAYENLLKSRRQALHCRVAEALRDNAATAAAEPELLAHHFTQAGMTEAAIEWWGKAGQRSLESSALVESAEQFRRALAQIATLPATTGLRREQIRAQVALANALMTIKGYAAPETKAALELARKLIEQAEALGEPPEDPLLVFSVLYGVWGVDRIAVNGDAMRDLSAQFLALASKQSATVPLMNGHRIVGVSLLLTGDISEGRESLDRAITLYDPVEHPTLAARFAVDIAVSIWCYRSIALWLLGYPDAALADTKRVVQHARGIGQAASLMFALHHSSLTQIQFGHYAAANADADELAVLAEEKDASLWKASGLLWRGCLLTMTGKASDAIPAITAGLAALRSTGSTMWMPLLLTYLARAHSALGQSDEARRCIGEAMTAVETAKERWCESEVNRVAGEIWLRSPDPDRQKAEDYVRRALTVARTQQARSLELRAAMSMARLWRDQGKPLQARELLAPVYDWFTEGFDTLDLKEAKALLNSLAS
jgi:class 3 adenylate cyclase/predicted ATPase